MKQLGATRARRRQGSGGAERAGQRHLLRAFWFGALAALGGCDSLLGIGDVSRNEGPGAGGSGGSGGGQSGTGDGGRGGSASGTSGRGGSGTGGDGGSGTGGNGTGGSGANGTGGTGGAGTGGTGGDSGTGGGGTGGAPFPCDLVDPNGANDTPETASDPFGVDAISACERAERTLFDASAGGDIDWFKAFGSRTPCFETPTPSARVEPAFGALVCYYFRPLTNPDTPLDCKDPDFDAPPLEDGTRGCCGTDSVTPSFPGFETRLFWQVTPPGEADTCQSYELFVRY
jgi:hypothetical protein